LNPSYPILSRIEELGHSKALEEWEKRNPNMAGRFDTSTIAKAVQDFEKIINPHGIEH
jgi:hypothetical protein